MEFVPYAQAYAALVWQGLEFKNSKLEIVITYQVQVWGKEESAFSFILLAVNKDDFKIIWLQVTLIHLWFAE